MLENISDGQRFLEIKINFSKCLAPKDQIRLFINPQIHLLLGKEEKEAKRR